jgi:hypothetical protein
MARPAETQRERAVALLRRAYADGRLELEEFEARAAKALAAPTTAHLNLQLRGLLVDEARLAFPGDLLHEAGHVAAAPAWARPSLSGAIDVPGLDTSNLEWAAIPWSYAAALAIGIDPAIVFHGGGYRGHSEGLLATFAAGVPIGAHLLEEAGMTAVGARAAALGVPPYPHMLRWLRE